MRCYHFATIVLTGASKNHLPESACRLLVDVFQEAPIDVHGDLNAAMPELVLDVLRVLALVDEEACISMSEVMEPDLGKFRSSERGEEPPLEHIRAMLRVSGHTWEHQVKGGRRARELPLLQLVDQFWREVDLSP